MMKPLFSLSLGSALFFGASLAAAQQPQSPNCPPGSWFCADAQGQTATPAGQPVQPLQPLPGQGTAPPAVQYQPAPAPPPVVVYQPPPPVMVVTPMHPDQPPPVYVYTPREPLARKNEWGINAHLAGAMIGGRGNSSSGMGGLGFGLRYKPIAHLGVEADLDFFGGRDYNGFRRGETAFAINGLLYVNPKSRAQLYFLGGFGWSAARVVDDGSGFNQATYNYGYFGGQLGVGLEWRVSRHFALNADLRGFIRGRVDDNTHYRPEFFDPATGKSTNTSGGGLITGGMTFYF
jgi:hypothetical protein